MKKLIFLLLLLTACTHKEDAPGTYVPHIAGSWIGNGTDDSIGYYNWSVDLTQSNSSAAGSFTTSGGYGTTSGSIYLTLDQGNLVGLTMSRTSGVCLGTANLSGPVTITNTDVAFYYTISDCHGVNSGGANLHKIVGTN
ncbi:MAG: hypothetical protein ACREBR_04870 [bacterium]